ncbi:GapR family DNA-binding domain-containing protein [Rhizobium sp. BK176]|uniref:DUF2312 domain-containing protein n=1 Tax=Rhizobium sp. BK176 TaxID=2587071 RepID=UPI002168D65F|nr:GapR family DNA-binding domain-containing protein [Rhizobium sp. BK176]MCS4089834.1 uncharacterized protein (UPF0335 family) [Rhizobium sp. BK176]
MSDEQATSGTVAPDMLRGYIERIQRLETEKAETASAIKEVYGEAKGNGLNVAIMKKLISILKQADGNSKREEFESELDVYLAALGVIEHG